jgi:hypothetical protein
MAMTKEEKKARIRQLLSEYVSSVVKNMASGAVLRSADVEGILEEFEQKWLEDYHGEAKIPHYVLREFIKYIEEIRKPYNAPFLLEIDEAKWIGDEPELKIEISSAEHNLLGSIEVNVYAKKGDGYEVVQCGVSIDDDKNISIRTATRFAGRIEVFCSVGETPELQHRQPVYTVNGIGPDDFGDISFKSLADEILAAHNNDPDAHGVLIEKVLSWI